LTIELFISSQCSFLGARIAKCEKINTFSKLKIIFPNTSFIIFFDNNDGLISIEYSSESGFISGYSPFPICNKNLENSI
jgi:hypothetical protein